jgi:predicted dehydrogenase
MTQQRLGIIMNGVTGRMGMNQHLIRSIVAIRAQGGVTLRNGDTVMPDPILVGRNEAKLAQLAKANGVTRWTTDLNAALKNPEDTLFFDAATTKLRAKLLRKAIAAGKDIYCEKPTAENLKDALEVAQAAKKAGIRHGVVQDKLFLPGLLKLKTLIDSGFFGRILAVRGEFGYWVFEGDWQPAQRPSWNYRKKDGGGIILDMLCHWRYVLDNLFGEVKSVSCLGATHIHAWLGGGRPAEMLEPGAREHAATGVESGRAAADQVLRDLGRGARQRQLRQRLQDGMGDVHPPSLRRYSVQVDAGRRRQGRAAGRGRAQELEGAALDRYPAAEGVMPMS